MDSKVKRVAIISVSLMVAGVLGVVIMLNELFSKQESTMTQNAPESRFRNGDELSESELKAFLQDETFFDQKSARNYAQVDEKALSLQVTSVEKDLRIKILNYKGEPVSGQSFYVTLEGKGEYKDLDQDGIIYIGGLQAGEYSVSMNPAEGYTIPAAPIRAAVRDKVEYLAIDDISYLIKTEDEIDAALEDTEEKGALEDADATEDTLAKKDNGDFSFGIDVSKYNKEIDWNKAKEAGVEFAIIRCGYRGSSTGSLVEDPYFQSNIENAAKAGVLVGLYFFTQAVNEVEAVEEASMVLTLLGDRGVQYPIFIDTEGAGGNGRADALDRETRTLVCEAFAKTIEASGYRAGIYASKNWLNNNLYVEKLSDYAIWLAEYKEKPTYEGEYHMWQYSSKGSIDGIEGRVDLNISYLK